jgi:hypothetical protein
MNIDWTKNGFDDAQICGRKFNCQQHHSSFPLSMHARVNK